MPTIILLSHVCSRWRIAAHELPVFRKFPFGGELTEEFWLHDPELASKVKSIVFEGVKNDKSKVHSDVSNGRRVDINCYEESDGSSVGQQDDIEEVWEADEVEHEGSVSHRNMERNEDQDNDSAHTTDSSDASSHWTGERR